MGFLLYGIQYYGSLPDYPGTQLGVEWRKYALAKSTKRSENFLYVKLLSGHQQQRDQYGSGFTNHFAVPEGYYYGAGLGIGKHLNFNRFFLDFNGGLKIVKSTVSQDISFFLTGPASYLDIHFNLGFQF